jgi:ABC-type amino acid transport substrate-binding protein
MRYPGFNQSSAAQRCLLNTLRLIAVTLGLAWPAIVFAGTLDDIRESGEITLAYRADTPPFSSRGKDKQPEGFTIDLCNNIVADIKAQLDLDELKVNWIEVSSGERIDAIASGRAQIECGATTITFKRQEKVDFSNLTYATGASLMTWADADIDNIFDLNGKKVAVLAGTTTEQVLRNALKENRINARVVVVDNHAQAVLQLADHEVDAMAGDQATLFGIGFKTQADNNFIITEDMLSFEPFALPLPRNDADFRLAVNRSLSNTYIRGDVGRSWEKWFGKYNVQPTRMLLTLYRLNSFVE